MNMKSRKTTLLAVLCWCSAQVLAFGDADARNIAEKFYSCMKLIAEENYPSTGEPTTASFDARLEALGLCHAYNIHLPNDFWQFNFGDDLSSIAAEEYASRLLNIAIEKRDVKYRPTISRIMAYEEIKGAKSENSTNFYSVYVNKTISAGGITKAFTDTVLVCVEQGGKIAKITNYTSVGGSGGESVMTLRGRAAELFAQKKYQEAYDTYLKVISKDEKQGDAYYRLGLMAYHNLGCKNRFKNKSARLQQAYDYIKLAEKNGNHEIQEYSRRVRYYMENGSV